MSDTDIPLDGALKALYQDTLFVALCGYLQGLVLQLPDGSDAQLRFLSGAQWLLNQFTLCDHHKFQEIYRGCMVDEEIGDMWAKLHPQAITLIKRILSSPVLIQHLNEIL